MISDADLDRLEEQARSPLDVGPLRRTECLELLAEIRRLRAGLVYQVVCKARISDYVLYSSTSREDAEGVLREIRPDAICPGPHAIEEIKA